MTEEARPQAKSESGWTKPQTIRIPAYGADGASTLSRKWKYALGVLVLLVNLPLLALGLRPAATTTKAIPPTGFLDDFNRSELGQDYWSSGAYWRVVNGELLSPGAKNNPLWLRAELPDNVQVDFDARSDSPDGDLKCEIFGDGYLHASGYLFIFGGWNNSVTALARLDEHGMSVNGFGAPQPNAGRIRVERRDLKVEQGKTYHWTLRRQNATLSWQLDGKPVLEVNDGEPLKGPGHDRFAFSTWDVDGFYDNLRITPL